MDVAYYNAQHPAERKALQSSISAWYDRNKPYAAKFGVGNTASASGSQQIDAILVRRAGRSLGRMFTSDGNGNEIYARSMGNATAGNDGWYYIAVGTIAYLLPGTPAYCTLSFDWTGGRIAFLNKPNGEIGGPCAATSAPPW